MKRNEAVAQRSRQREERAVGPDPDTDGPCDGCRRSVWREADPCRCNLAVFILRQAQGFQDGLDGL